MTEEVPMRVLRVDMRTRAQEILFSGPHLADADSGDDDDNQEYVYDPTSPYALERGVVRVRL